MGGQPLPSLILRLRGARGAVDGERSVGDLQPLVGIESSHLSQRLAVLRRAGLVTTRKDGSSVVYTIRGPETVTLLAVARRMLFDSLEAAVEHARSHPQRDTGAVEPQPAPTS